MFVTNNVFLDKNVKSEQQQTKQKGPKGPRSLT